MATGTSGGLLDDPEGHAQSVFKHAILSKYMLPFVAMVGSASSGRRMVVLDGYAGRGRYRSGEPGSAELILRVIKNFRDSRQVLAYFVEKEPKDYGALAVVVDEYARQGLRAKALQGAVEDHLDTVIAAATGYPLSCSWIRAAWSCRSIGWQRCFRAKDACNAMPGLLR